MPFLFHISRLQNNSVYTVSKLTLWAGYGWLTMTMRGTFFSLFFLVRSEVVKFYTKVVSVFMPRIPLPKEQNRKLKIENEIVDKNSKLIQRNRFVFAFLTVRGSLKSATSGAYLSRLFGHWPYNDKNKKNKKGYLEPNKKEKKHISALAVFLSRWLAHWLAFLRVSLAFMPTGAQQKEVTIWQRLDMRCCIAEVCVNTGGSTQAPVAISAITPETISIKRIPCVNRWLPIQVYTGKTLFWNTEGWRIHSKDMPCPVLRR